jgi:curved DNA-binding protein
MEYKDYYKILGVDRTAGEKDIRRAYRRLARMYHPDVNPGDKASQERFKEINEAHEVLSDPEKRSKYDRLGTSWQEWQKMGYDPSQFDWGQWFAHPGEGVRMEYVDLGNLFGGGSPFSDFFRTIFGDIGGSASWSGTRSRARQGQDYQEPVEIALEEALRGTTRIVSTAGHRLEVKIPPGVDNGSKVRIAGEGGPGQGGGSKGDLYLVIKVTPHSRFQRQGQDLQAEMPIDLYAAVLGGEVKVPTISGELMLKIPPETQGGKTFRLKGQGMPKLGTPKERGDLYVTVRVRLPQRLSPKERQLFEELAKLR